MQCRETCLCSQLTLSEADADSDGGEEEAEGGDGDEEGGPDPEPGEGVADVVAQGYAPSVTAAAVAVVRRVGVALGQRLGGVAAMKIHVSVMSLHFLTLLIFNHIKEVDPAWLWAVILRS